MDLFQKRSLADISCDIRRSPLHPCPRKDFPSMQGRETDIEGISKGDSGDDEELSLAAQAEIAALARGVVPLADEAFPWPPPSYVWHRRTAEDILTHARHRKKKKCSAQSRVLSLGNRVLDDKLSRCFALGSLVEIVGEAGTGKTQLALTLAAETVIQWFDRHKICSHARETRSVSSAASNVSNESIGVPATIPQAQESRCQPRNPCQNGVKDVNFFAESFCMPAVVYYIHTEGAFPVERLHEIVVHRQQRRDTYAGTPDSRFPCTNKEHSSHVVGNRGNVHTKLLLERIFTEEICNEEQLWSSLTHRLPRLTVCHRVALVVLDSIAAIFRPTASDGALAERNCDATSADMLMQNRKKNTLNQLGGGFIDRASKLLRVGALLRRLSAAHDFCCLVVNQVSGSCHTPFGNDTNAGGNSHSLSGLGLAQPFIPKYCCTRERLAPLRSRGGRCSVDGKYLWTVKSAHGPIFENFRVQPSLGLTWSNALTCRLLLCKERGSESSSDTVGGGCRLPLRCCYAIFGSDVHINEKVCFEVNLAGVEED